MAIRLLLYCVLYTIAWWCSPTAGYNAARDSLFGLGNPNNSKAGGPPPELPLKFRHYAPQNVYVHAGKSIVLNCTGYESHSDYGPISIFWLHDGFPIVHNDRRYVSDGQLHISRVSDDRIKPDEGEYICVITNSGGSLRARPIKLHIARLHLDKGPVLINDFKEGSVGSLSCVIESSPAANITWLKDDVPLPKDPRYIQLPTGYLYVSSVQANDAGRYKCRVENIVLGDVMTSEEVRVEIKNRSRKMERPWFHIPDYDEDSVRTTIGGDATLRCLAQGNPSPRVFWTKNGNNLTSAVDTGNYAEFHIRNAKQSDQGVYKCHAQSEEFFATEEVTVTLEVMVPPYFDSVSKSQHVLASAIVRMNCSAKGNPTPATMWIKNGREIDLTAGITIGRLNNQLLIRSTNSRDAGIYQCIANNDAGWASHAAFIKIKSNTNMSIPKNVRVHNITSTSATVSWTIDDVATDLRAFTVHYYPKGEVREKTVVVINDTFLEVKKLQPYTVYRVYVRYYKTTGASDPSLPCDFMTDEGVPLAPLEVTFKLSFPSLLVKWKPLSDRQAQGRVTHYRIQWKIKGPDQDPSMEVLSANTTQFLITDMTPGETYLVRVLAATKKGFPKRDKDIWKWYKFTMRNSSSPLILTLSPIGSSSILASWKLNSSSSRITATKIHLEYGKDKGDLIEVLLDSSSYSYLIDDLDADTNYVVSVYGIFDNLDGENTLKYVKTLSSDGGWALDAPRDLKGTNVSATTVGLSWISVDIMDHYSIQYHVDEQPRKRNVVFSNSSSVTIKGLSPNTSYEFRVRCHTKQPSPGRHAQLKIRTKREVPGVVRGLKSLTLNGTATMLMWSPPNVRNGPLEAYVINFTSDPNRGPWKQTQVIPPRPQTTIAGLEVGREYIITVAAKNSAGVGPSAKISFFTVGFDDVSDVPFSNNTSKNNDSKGNADSLFYIVLAVVAVVVILVAAAIFICCRKIQSKDRPRNKTTSNGYPHNRREMQTMLPEDMDTKGGSSPKRANGLSHPVTLDCQLHYKELISRNDTPLLPTADHVATESVRSE